VSNLNPNPNFLSRMIR